MADKFYDGMPNVNEKLNDMDRAFAAGPYNALPLTGGVMSGPLANTYQIYSTHSIYARSVDGLTNTSLYAPVNNTGNTLDRINPAMSLGVTGIAGKAFEGAFIFATRAGRGGSYVKDGFSLYLRALDTSPGGQLSPGLLIVRGNGYVTIPKYVRIGTPEEYDDTYYSVIQNPNQVEGTRNLEIVNSAIFNVGATGYGNGSECVMRVTQTSLTGRSINAAGTINASGADYAEYMFKAPACGVVAAGQVIGIGADGKLTDRWADAISFAVKSTDPCMVGGDKWSQQLGQRPASVTRALDRVESMLASEAQPAVEAIYDGLTLLTPAIPAKAAVYREVPLAGDTDEEWAVRQAPGLAFDAALEALRQTVDRIAFAGQVPCNIQGAVPGQFIVPVQDGAGIAGIAINETDMTFQQYTRAVGKVIAVEDDGRARVIVKVA
ncbi:hypothetical protein VM94_03004 [Janthinobacterium sp. KBS0711]|uniref:hypothetical protein n=1 Tax=Janthinobacterium sp. KBS0711 TaxID=1649647 RepID=UPI000639AC8A|nr:hypothetical protein [Janthinobacterium sp. KBS0711]KKO63254.1 hypothetical protein VM94_03004 [Janthinobacterium sp. KBS0711]TSD72763.1 hypothetical protein FFI39_018260 [Janthinobacterium sp. KBS0711]